MLMANPNLLLHSRKQQESTMRAPLLTVAIAPP
jgi:hypothetical protein